MTDGIMEFVEEQLAIDEQLALDAGFSPQSKTRQREWTAQVAEWPGGERPFLDGVKVTDRMGIAAFVANGGARAKHAARHDPATVLADVAGKRAILAEVLSWQHAHVDGDTWLSCAQAVDPHDEDDTPGSGCADEKRAGGPCDCGPERRRAMMLNALAAGYVGRPGFKDDWRLT